MLTESAPEVHRLAHVACLARAVAAAGNQRVIQLPRTRISLAGAPSSGVTAKAGDTSAEKRK